MRALILLTIYLLCQVAYADAVTINESTSPNGKYYLAIIPEPNAGDGSGTLEIRRASDGKAVCSFDWYQYDSVISPSSAAVLWRKDSDAVAVTTDTTRHGTSSYVYVKDATKWVDCSDDLEEKASALREEYVRNGWQDHSRLSFAVTKWTAKDGLIMDWGSDWYRFNKAGQMEFGPSLKVYFKVQLGKTPALVATKVEEEAP